MALSSNLTVFSDVTDGAPLSPAYLSGKFGVLDKNILEINTTSQAVTGIFNVKDATYGATGDGSTDDGAAIQAAIDAAEAASSTIGSGGVVYFPAGTYCFATGLTVQSNQVQLVGEGIQTSILDYTGSAVAVTLGQVATPIFRWKMKDLFVNGSNATGTIGVELNYAREGVMEDVWIGQGWSTAGVSLTGSAADVKGNWTNRFSRVHFHTCDAVGLFVGAQSNAVVFEGCRWTSCGTDNVLIHYANGVSFTNCQFENAGSGIEIRVTNPDSTTNGVNSLILIGCYFEQKAATSGARSLYIIENTTGGGKNHIEGFYASGCYCFGTNGSDYAFEFDNANKCYGMVVGCYFHGLDVAGVRTTQGADRIGVIGHTARDAHGGGSALPLMDTNSGAGNGVALEFEDDKLVIERDVAIEERILSTTVTTMPDAATPNVDSSN